ARPGGSAPTMLVSPLARGSRTGEEDTFGVSRRLPSIAAAAVDTVTIYRVSAWGGARGVGTSVTGSRHSIVPAIPVARARYLQSARVRSSDPGTGRSDVISMAMFGAASAAGLTRSTRSAAGDEIKQAATPMATSDYRLDGVTRAEDG